MTRLVVDLGRFSARGSRSAWREGREGAGPVDRWEALAFLLLWSFTAVQAFRGEWLVPIAVAGCTLGTVLLVTVSEFWKRRQRLSELLPSHRFLVLLPLAILVLTLSGFIAIFARVVAILLPSDRR